MTEAQFWALIEGAGDVTDWDPIDQLGVLEARLGFQSIESIRDFENCLRRLMHESYTTELWGAAHLMQGGCSEEAFEYFRAWLISRGEFIFRTVLQHPDSLASLGRYENYQVALEELLSTAACAYQEKTGRDTFFEDLPSLERPCYAPLGEKINFEDDRTMASKYPALFSLYCLTE